MTKIMQIIRRDNFTDKHGDKHGVFKIQGRWGSVWAINMWIDEKSTDEKDEFNLPFFTTRKKAIAEIVNSLD